jgi:Fibronectin type III domain
MVKWSVLQSSSSDGSLPIQFFKVQYMLIPAESQHRKNEDWITLSEDIPPHLRSYEIQNLKADHHYKFRISAVYSNNDNKQSPIRRFHLKRIKENNKIILPVPMNINVEPVSETEVKIKWSLPDHHHNFGGFYILYRPTTSADDYLVVSCEGSRKRHFNIKHLEPGMIYEFKIQSFSSVTVSDYSSIVTGRTLSKINVACTKQKVSNFLMKFINNLIGPTTSMPTHTTSKPLESESKGQSSLLPIIVGAIGGCALLFLIFILIFIALKKRRDMVNSQREGKISHSNNVNFFFFVMSPTNDIFVIFYFYFLEQESKSNPMQVDSVVNGGRSPIHRNNNRHLNGIIRINITPNPLSDEKVNIN